MRYGFFIGILLMCFTSTQAQEADSLSVDSTSMNATVLELDSVIGFAQSLIGVPYKYGGCSPDGFDCSGFVNYVYSQFGISLPRSTPELAVFGLEVPLDSCMKGDIILFSGRDKKKRPVGHAGIVVSDAGEPLRFIHSATSNARGVIVTAFDAYEYYLTRFVKIVRVTD
ncbi:MAG: C40 family peptidase [Flavobacteriales bacterium]|nr:C40 family peptidase [Flavobacteriales bacterium]